MRAARAEVGLAHRGHARPGERLFLGVEVGKTCAVLVAGALIQNLVEAELCEPLGERARDDLGRVLVLGGQQPCARRLAGRLAPLAVVVELADDARGALAGFPGVELFFDLVFDQLALFLDDEDLFEAFGKAPGALRLERPGHRDLVDPQADVACDGLIDAEVGQRLHRVAERLAGRDDAQARARRIPDDAIELVGTHVGEGGVHLVVEEACFLLEDAVGPADVESARRQHEVFRDHDLDPVRVDVDRGARLDHVGHALEPDPAARVAAHREAVQPVVEVFLHARGVQHRDQAGLEDVLALVGEGR